MVTMNGMAQPTSPPLRRTEHDALRPISTGSPRPASGPARGHTPVHDLTPEWDAVAARAVDVTGG